MSKKKNWLMVKRGLSEDPKHREAIGNRIWLFLHLIDRADWETGVVNDWRDKDEADDMGLEWRTLQRQRQELHELGYITCKKGKDKQSIIIHEWVNPKNYSGETLNSKSTEKQVLSGHKSTPKSTPKPNSDLRTPSIESMNQVSSDDKEFSELFPARPHPIHAPGPHTPQEDKARIT